MDGVSGRLETTLVAVVATDGAMAAVTIPGAADVDAPLVIGNCTFDLLGVPGAAVIPVLTKLGSW